MKKWSKRLLSIICAVVLVVTSVYVTDYKKAKAATEMSITTKEWGYNYVSNGGSGYINMSYTGVASDYASNGQNFLDETFAAEYITFGGGMTYADLIDGMVSFYVATNNILQFNWANRTNPFTYGWSFTIAKGALLPYVSTSGTSYMALDKEYTFTFIESTHGYDCEVTIVGCNVTTFSLGKLSIWGNGVSGEGEAITITSIDGVSNWNTTYTYIHNDASYEKYVEISDLTFDKYDGDIKLRYILAGGTTCLQMEEWGSLRTSMTKGDQLIFRKGLPIYFVDGSGNQWKALLDATYVYEVDGSNSDNTQTFYGVKLADSILEYGLNISSSQTTAPQGNEQYMNVGFDYATVQAGAVQAHSTSEDILLEKIAEDYIQVANYTPAEASAMGIAFRYIPNANCIQMGFGASAVAKLQVGDNIILKDGTPVVYKYNGVLYAAKLDAGYIFTVTANNGTNLTFSRKLYDTYTLTGTTSGPNVEGDNKYVGLHITPDEFEDAQSRGEWRMDEADWKSYVTLSEHTYDQMIAGGVHIKEYTYLSNVFQGIRFYSGKDFAYVDGEQLTFKKGFPVVYNTNVVNYSDGSGVKSKGTYLDKDYVFVYNASTGKFVYDASLGNTEEEETIEVNVTINHKEFGSFLEGGYYKSNVSFIADKAITCDADVNLLSNAETASYIDKASVLSDVGGAIKFIPSAGVFQFVWSTDFSNLQVGDTITLAKGMPIHYQSGGKAATAVLSDTVTILVRNIDTANTEQPALFGTYTEEATFGIATPEFTATTGSNDLINVLNGALDDANTTYYTLSSKTLARYADFCGITASQMDTYGLKLLLIRDGATQVLQIQWGSDVSYVTDGATILLKRGMPFIYTTTSGTYKCVRLDKDYGFTYSASRGTFVYDELLGNVEGTFKFTTTEMDTFFEVEKYRMNLSYECTTAVSSDEVQVSVITNATSVQYMDFCGFDADMISQIGVDIRFIPSAGVFQVVYGASLEYYNVGDTITFRKGMPVFYTQGGEQKKIVLEETIRYTITSLTADKMIVAVTAESAEYVLQNQFGTGSNAQSNIGILNPDTGVGDVLNDATVTYSMLSADVVASYIDFFGMTAAQLTEYGVTFQLIYDGGVNQVIQLTWGSAIDKVKVGDQLIFKAGMPLTYKTTSNLTKTVYLAQDHIYTIGGSNDENTWYLNYTIPEEVSTLSINSGAAYIVVGSADGEEGYFNNIDLADCDYVNDVAGPKYVTLTTDVIKGYVDFAGLDVGTYGFSVIFIIDGDNKVVQLRWGSATSAVKDGDQLIFKAGLPITVEVNGETKKYALDADHTFTIQKYANGKNGFRITGVQEVETTTAPGDMDQDYIMNVNDINLVRKQLVGLVAVSDSICGNANEDAENAISSQDLVHALKNWDVEEEETYTELYEDIQVPSSANLAKGETLTVNINANLGTVNYLRLTYKATQNIYGTFYYTYNGTAYQENFYLAANEVQFEQFLDNYRRNGVLRTTSATSKTLTKITFKNVGGSDAEFLLHKLEMADRDFENNNMIYIENSDIKIGVALNMGGALGWFESLKYTPVEYRNTSDRTLHIEPSADYTSASNKQNVIYNVNLVNIYDLGRQMQQSYYIDVQDSSYTHGTYNSKTWPYNPVQSGDENDNQSQIIDYRKIDSDGDGVLDMVYVKTRAMDWSNPNNDSIGTTTESYMKNYYKIVGNLLYIDNAFVDWAGWTDPGSQKTQELPAYYTGPALNYFVAGNDLSTRHAELGDWTVESESFHVDGENTSDWYAWVNADSDNAFGLGIYIPNADACTAGRCSPENRYSRSSLFDWGGTTRNMDASDAPIFDLGFSYLSALSEYQNCYLFNTSYIAPTATTILREYQTYKYTYVLCADKLTNMASTFETLDESGAVTNDEIDAW